MVYFRNSDGITLQRSILYTLASFDSSSSPKLSNSCICEKLNQTQGITYVGGANTTKVQTWFSFHIFVKVVINYQKGGD